MKRLTALILFVTFLSSAGLAQDATVRRHSSGPRRQLATIVFAGLGGAILGLSTLSFYGRPQDNLANIAIGFAAGVIGGTAFVTFRTATTRDYYDEHKEDNQSLLQNQVQEDEEPKIVYGPLLTKVAPDHSAVGGQIALRF